MSTILPAGNPAVSSYAFGQLADRLVGIAFAFDGTVRPMKRGAPSAPASPASTWHDLAGTLGGTTVANGNSIEFVAKVPDGQRGLICVEFSGWSLPYDPGVAYVVGPSWPFGQTEVSYNAAAENPRVECSKPIKFTFVPRIDSGTGQKTAVLSWLTGLNFAQGGGSATLDSQNMASAYVVIRVFGGNTCSLQPTIGSFGFDANGAPLQGLSIP